MQEPSRKKPHGVYVPNADDDGPDKKLRKLRLALEFIIVAGFLKREKLAEAEQLVEQFHPNV